MNTGRTHFKKGNAPWNKGLKGVQKPYWLGKKRPDDPFKGKRRKPGYKLSEEHKDKIRQAQLRLVRAGTHPMWRGGITPERTKIWRSPEYRKWREEVFKRDNYMCIIGGKKHGSKLQADHIKPFSRFPKLRFVVKNGRTLCISCHQKTPTYGGNSMTHLCQKSAS